jgi:hypothetical protein
MDTAPPTLIALGLLIMTSARGRDLAWNVQFWLGEALVIGMFIYNSLSFVTVKKPVVLAGIAVASLLLALWFRGSVWNYAAVLGLIVFFAVIVALGFPIMELILESILNEKLKRVGHKVRLHHQVLQAHYEKKIKR